MADKRNPNKADKSTRSVTLPIVLLDLVDLLVEVTDAKSRREVLVRLLLDEADYLILELQHAGRDAASVRVAAAARDLEAAEGAEAGSAAALPPGAPAEATDEEGSE